MKKILTIVVLLTIVCFAQDRLVSKKPIQISEYPVAGLKDVRYIYFDPLLGGFIGDKNVPATAIYVGYIKADSVYLESDFYSSGFGIFAKDISAENVYANDSLVSNILKSKSIYSIIDSGSSVYKNFAGVTSHKLDYKKLFNDETSADRLGQFTLYTGTNKIYFSGLSSTLNIPYLQEYDFVVHDNSSTTGNTTTNQEKHKMLYVSNDTLYVDGIWSYPSGTYNQYYNFYKRFFIKDLTRDTSYYHQRYFGDTKEVMIPSNTKKMTSNISSSIVSKKGGVLFRHDNWMTPYEDMKRYIMEWVTVLNKYNLKATLALNERWEGDTVAFRDDLIRFWQYLQQTGHEIADHGMNHSNWNYEVEDEYLKVNEQMDGVDSIRQTTIWGKAVNRVYMSTYGGFTSLAGQDLMFKRAKEMFRFLGLAEPTYWIEGGGQAIYYNPDSVHISSRLNGFVGGGKYRYYNNYKHSGYNPPLGWIGKSDYCMDWQDVTSICPTASQGGGGDRKYDAKTAISQIADQSARHTLTIIGEHFHLADQWVLDWYDSVGHFIAANPFFVKQMTGSDWARTMFQSQTNPYENIIPSFEFDIDGDLIPDGWDFWITRFTNNGAVGEGNTVTYPIKNYSTLDRWVEEGSQGSNFSVAVTSTDTLYCHNLYGVEKGTNKFKIDIKELDSGSDSVHVRFVYYYGDNSNSLSNSSLEFVYPVTSSWVSHESEITFPINTSYLRIFIFGDNGNASLVDELYLGLKQ